MLYFSPPRGWIELKTNNFRYKGNTQKEIILRNNQNYILDNVQMLIYIYYARKKNVLSIKFVKAIPMCCIFSNFISVQKPVSIISPHVT